MLRDANFVAVFIGIESPDPDVLIAAQKKQNTRRDIAASVHKVQAMGMFVVAGFIVGFDNEGEHVSQSMIDLIEEACIPVCMVGLLYALPNTQLTRRLEREGRLHVARGAADLDFADQCLSGLNFETLRRRELVLGDYRRWSSASIARMPISNASAGPSIDWIVRAQTEGCGSPPFGPICASWRCFFGTRRCAGPYFAPRSGG